MNREGWALPLQHHTTSGGPSFQVVASSTTRAHSSTVVTSARIEWKRWVSGLLALFYMFSACCWERIKINAHIRGEVD